MPKMIDTEAIIACLKANPEALTPQQWAEVLSALSPSMQDGITDALVERDVIWGTDATRSRAMRNTALLARAEQAERALATVTAERDEARAERAVAVKEEDRAKFNLDKAAEQLAALQAKLAEAEKQLAWTATHEEWRSELDELRRRVERLERGPRRVG